MHTFLFLCFEMHVEIYLILRRKNVKFRLIKPVNLIYIENAPIIKLE